MSEEPNIGANGPEFTLDDLNVLVEEVEHQGGAILPDRCEGQLVRFPKPRGKGFDEAHTCGCGNETMAVVTYDPVAETSKKRKSMLERGAGFARVCLVCDLGMLWPRFKSAFDEAA
jgi:hypothetical protein